MYLDCETILDLYTHGNKKVLCQIKINPKSGKLKNLLRCLTQEHWKAFDDELEKVITTTDVWNNEKCLIFTVTSHIHVKVKKSSLNPKHFYNCFGIIDIGNTDRDARDEDAKFVLECLFEKVDVAFSSSMESHNNIETSRNMSQSLLSYTTYYPSREKYENNEIDILQTPATMNVNSSSNVKNISSHSELLNYTMIKGAGTIESPFEKVNNSRDHNTFSKYGLRHIVFNETEDENERKSLETGLNINCKTFKSHEDIESKLTNEKSILDTVTLRNTEENFSQKKNKKCHHHSNTTKRSETLDETPERHSKHKMKQICDKSNTKFNREDRITFEESENKKIIKDENEIAVAFGQQSKKSSKTQLNLSEDAYEDNSEISKYIIGQKSSENKKKSYLSAIEKIAKSSDRDTTKSVRRSVRSPSKPKRFSDEQSIPLNVKKSKKHTSTRKHTEIEDNSYSKNEKIKVSVIESLADKGTFKCTSPSLSSKKKRKKDKNSSECQQEKRDMNNWLSKKKLFTSKNESTKPLKFPIKTSSSKSLPLKSLKKKKAEEHSSKPSTPIPIALDFPTKQEIELMRNKTKLIQTENAKVRAELDKLCTSPPKAVEILSLQTMQVNDILNTFLTYKPELDEIYENNRKRDYIKGHDGINHCFVIRLLQQNVQMKMLEKLTEVYSNSKTTTQATLFANALLPEWVIRVYMKKFNFTRQQAIEQIKAQEEFQLHLEAQSDNSFMFD